MHGLETIHKLNAEAESNPKPRHRAWDVAEQQRSMIIEIARASGASSVIHAKARAATNENPLHVDSRLYVSEIIKSIEQRDAEIAMLKEQLDGMEVQVKRADAGIQNPEAVREVIEAAAKWYTHGSKTLVNDADERLHCAIAALSAPSTGAQQK